MRKERKKKEPKPNKREQVIVFRTDFDTTDQLHRASKTNGKTISSYVNDVLLDYFKNRRKTIPNE